MYAPRDIFTVTARVLVTGLCSILIVLGPIAMITTALGGCLAMITFGILFFVLSVIWWPFMAFLVGTSWLWLRAWYLRPILLVPGVMIAFLADLFVMLAPEPERDAKHMKLAITGEWLLVYH
jgi:hypothetical protein